MENSILKNLKADNKNWEIWCDLNISKRHFCEDHEVQSKLSIYGVAIIRASSEGADEHWYLAKVCLADEQVVYDGEADEIGEVLELSCFRICYCPFCGEKLLN